MHLLLARHGNTFGPDDKVVMAGLTNDLPLVEKGGIQAEALAEYLMEKGTLPTVVVSGTLRRQRRTAEIIMERLGIPGEPIIDGRLDEIDYGPWTGLTDEEIKIQFGEQAFEDWQLRSITPNGRYGWPENDESIAKRVKSFASDVLINYSSGDDVVLAVSSNGVLRFFLQLVEGEFEKRHEEKTFKVATGGVCSLTHLGAAWRIDYWGEKPL